MDTTVEKTESSVKKFVRKHKTALAVVATATVAFAINQSALKQHNDFLKEHGLYEKFYTPEG